LPRSHLRCAALVCFLLTDESNAQA
jgi:hypothetical protein